MKLSIFLQLKNLHNIFFIMLHEQSLFSYIKLDVTSLLSSIGFKRRIFIIGVLLNLVSQISVESKALLVFLMPKQIQ